MTSKIKDLIINSNSILLLTHENPDGDAIGSVLAFYHYLKSINKTVDMVVIDIPKIFNFLPSIDKIVDNTNDNYDLGIVFDCTSELRIGQKDNLIDRCRNTICIDHHISNLNYCDINYIESDTSSCCQVIYYLLKSWNVSISLEIGEAIINGVITDTIGFGVNTVNSDTFRLAAELSDLGVDIYSVYNKVIHTKSMAQYMLSRVAMDRLELIYDNKIAFTYILKEDFDKFNASLGDHEGIVNIGRNIEGVEVSVFMREDDGFNISFRSTGNVDVREIALIFDGGGHRLASGAKSYNSFEDTKEKIINEIKKVI